MIELNVSKKLFSAEGAMTLDVRLNLSKGSFTTVFGASGAGKTTLLKILAGIVNPEKGTITVDGVTWLSTQQKIRLHARKRKVGIVFQDYALFPNMTVLQNLEYALDKNQNKDIVRTLIEMMELEGLKDKKPAVLSGGQQQRVALARALVRRPQILVLDEPLSALDYKMRNKLQEYLLRVHVEYHLTTILVSHDPGEIIKLSDRVIELEKGKIVKTGMPADFFGLPKTSAKFKFTGEILDILRDNVICVVTILVGNDIVKVVADPSEASTWKAGDKVMVASKAFNPVIQKL